MKWKKSKGAWHMKKKTVGWVFRRALVLCAAAACLCAGAAAQAFDADAADAWLEGFAEALAQMTPVNDPQQTADPARAGEYLCAYDFGTVLAIGGASGAPAAEAIRQIDVRTSQVTDPRGVRVGMGLADAMDGVQAEGSGAQLVVLSTQESGYGWSWAYVGDGGVYGVEYITYGGEDAAMREYTLTYVIEDGVIAAIRIKRAQATLAQAQEGLLTAEEIASKQTEGALARQNQAAMLAQADLTVQGGDALGAQVGDLVMHMGEPLDVQSLPQGSGRILVYDGAAVQLGLEEYTGVEIVRSVSVSSAAFTGPRGLQVGMRVQEATAIFRCDADVAAVGGTLYVEGEAAGEAPYGGIVVRAGETRLTYACVTDAGETAVLEAGVQDGRIAYWRLYFADDAKDGV